MPCGLIIGERTAATDDKVALNDLLRDFGSSLGRTRDARDTRRDGPHRRVADRRDLALRSARSAQCSLASARHRGGRPRRARGARRLRRAPSPSARIVQSRAEPDPQFWIGKGKVEELHDAVHTHAAPSW